MYALALLHSERPKLYTILAFLGATEVNFKCVVWSTLQYKIQWTIITEFWAESTSIYLKYHNWKQKTK